MSNSPNTINCVLSVEQLKLLAYLIRKSADQLVLVRKEDHHEALELAEVFEGVIQQDALCELGDDLVDFCDLTEYKFDKGPHANQWIKF